MIEYCGISGTLNFLIKVKRAHFGSKYFENAKTQEGRYDQSVINFAQVLRMAADMVETSQAKVDSQRQESGREVDPQAISDALFVLGATGLSIIRELVDSLPERPHLKRRTENSIFNEADVRDVLSKLVAGMGLVEESDLAALRKRIIDLEAKLAK